MYQRTNVTFHTDETAKVTVSATLHTVDSSPTGDEYAVLGFRVGNGEATFFVSEAQAMAMRDALDKALVKAAQTRGEQASIEVPGGLAS